MSNNFTPFDIARLNTNINRNLYGNIVRASNELVVGANRYTAAKSTLNTIKVYQSWKLLTLTMETAGAGTVLGNRSTYLRLGNTVTLNLSFNFTPDALDDGPIQNFSGLPYAPLTTNDVVYSNMATVANFGASPCQVYINDQVNAVDPTTDITLTSGVNGGNFINPTVYIVRGQITYKVA